MKNLIVALLFVCFPLSAAAAKTELRLKAADAEEGDQFGAAVAIQGDIAVVGSLYGGVAIHGTGSAYVFYRFQGGFDAWGQVAELSAPDGVFGDWFGQSVDIDGDIIAVGAEKAGARGQVYLFSRNSGGPDAWGHIETLAPNDPDADGFGISVALSGGSVIVGADVDNTLGFLAGAAFIFSPDPVVQDVWVKTTKLFSSNGADSNRFGESVDIDGDLVIVGERSGEGRVDDTGAAHIFGRNEGGADAWGLMAQLMASDGIAFDFFGSSVAIDGSTVIVGGFQSGELGSTAGAAYIFWQNQGGTDAWGEVQKILAPDGVAGDNFGYSVAISGTTVLCGAPGRLMSTGAVYGHGRNQGGSDNWGMATTLIASDGVIDDEMGKAVAKDGATSIASAPFESDGGNASGAVYIFFTASDEIFFDGFESHDAGAWDSVVP